MPTIDAPLKPCRFCGGADLLTRHLDYDVWLKFDGDEVARDADGDAVEETYDAVECLNCCVIAPLPVWQAGPEGAFAPAQRSAYAAFLTAEYPAQVAALPMAA